MIQSYLTLEEGSAFEGLASIEKEIEGEVVFTTGMTGYPESLTDPSFAEQILVFTHPIMGNFGVPDSSNWESEKIHVKGVVVNELCSNPSHSTSTQNLCKWLESQNVPILTGIDTRKLTKILRESGVMKGVIASQIKAPQYPIKSHLVSEVSLKKRYNVGFGKKKIIAVDCGMKRNIKRCLQALPIEIHYVPYDYDYSDQPFDGVFLSNGPGDPSECVQTIEVLKKAMKKRLPIFGICLGAQLMAHAAGAKTYKLQYGHRGHNQPCMDLRTGKCYITSQNHGFAVDEHTLPADWEVSFRNLNDQTVEGIAHKEFPFVSVQFHPEAAPGPTDTDWLFKEFYALL